MNPEPNERDPWLQAALRHAPDHDQAVPAAVRDAILGAARAAVHQPVPAPAPPRRRWPGLLGPLLQPARLGYSGAFMALLVLGLWGLDRLEPPTTSPAVTSTTVPAPSTLTEPPAAVVKPLRSEAAPTAKVKAAPVTVPATAPNLAPIPAPAAEATAPAAPSQDMAAAATAPAPATVMAKAAPQTALRARAASPAIAPDPVATLLAGLQQDPAARWQTALAQGLHSAAQAAWLARLQLATAGQWQPVATAPPSAPDVQWLGRETGQVWMGSASQVWLAWGGATHLAPLAADQASALQAALLTWR